ncbi:MAG: hypothetical protein V4693_21150 [Pseudomonadota bacterium]
MDDRNVLRGAASTASPATTQEVGTMPPPAGGLNCWDGVERRRGPVNPLRVAVVLSRDRSDGPRAHGDGAAAAPDRPAARVPGSA